MTPVGQNFETNTRNICSEMWDEMIFNPYYVQIRANGVNFFLTNFWENYNILGGKSGQISRKKLGTFFNPPQGPLGLPRPYYENHCSGCLVWFVKLQWSASEDFFNSLRQISVFLVSPLWCISSASIRLITLCIQHCSLNHAVAFPWPSTKCDLFPYWSSLARGVGVGHSSIVKRLLTQDYWHAFTGEFGAWKETFLITMDLVCVAGAADMKRGPKCITVTRQPVINASKMKGPYQKRQTQTWVAYEQKRWLFFPRLLKFTHFVCPAHWCVYCTSVPVGVCTAHIHVYVGVHARLHSSLWCFHPFHHAYSEKHRQSRRVAWKLRCTSWRQQQKYSPKLYFIH